MRRSLGFWAAIVIAIFTAFAVAKRGQMVPPPPLAISAGPIVCSPADNAAFAESIMRRRHVVEGVKVCGVVSATPHEYGGPHGLHVYIPVRLEAPGGATYVTEVIPNEELIGRVQVRRGDTIAALGQFVYPNERQGYEGLIHDTHPATHRGGADGYVAVNGTIYR